jgi:hypothetical protein
MIQVGYIITDISTAITFFTRQQGSEAKSSPLGVASRSSWGIHTAIPSSFSTHSSLNPHWSLIHRIDKKLNRSAQCSPGYIELYPSQHARSFTTHHKFKQFPMGYQYTGR